MRNIRKIVNLRDFDNQVFEKIKENPGTSVGLAACGVAIAFFPPAALVCGGAIAAGAGVDQANK